MLCMHIPTISFAYELRCLTTRPIYCSKSCMSLLLAVAVLNTLFKSLNSPGQLNGWQANGGDPCGQSWKGVICSGSGVTKMSVL